MESERAKRVRGFGEVVELYDRRRPGYPAALYTDVLGLGVGGRILEAGAGTGRATRALAARGASVVAIEPDPAMAAVARRRTRSSAIEVRESTFEECTVDTESFDLVVAAQAWHWVDPECGAQIAADALRPGGSLCVWWNRPDETQDAVWNAVQETYAEHAPALDRRGAVRDQARREHEIEPAAGFLPWTVLRYDWSTVYTADDYCELVQTQSDHLRLPPRQRDRLIAAIHAAINDAGAGRLEYRYRTVLVTAQVD